ncbi:MAG: hypothetical protein QOE58_2607 [Actinomycetota bacterium]|jgi:plastocyanin|nr:hypothetical protein [Actinomycetota bacterium]
MTPTRPLLAMGGFMLWLLAACAGPTPQASSPQTSNPGTSNPATSASQSPAASASSPIKRAPVKPPAATRHTTKSPSSAAKLEVHIRGFAYVPAAPVVVVGQPIEIINDDTAAHTWSASPGAGWTYTSGNLEKGQRATFPGFTKAGRYRFLCYYHAEMPSMNGVATVKAAP